MRVRVHVLVNGAYSNQLEFPALRVVICIFSECVQNIALIAQLPDSSITADSSHDYDALHVPSRARLHTQHEAGGPYGAWTSNNHDAAWIQANLLSFYFVNSVATQGRNHVNQWVTSYSLQTGADVSSLASILDAAGATRVFDANSDRDSVVVNAFEPVRAWLVRLDVVTFHSFPSMRWEVYGCIGGKATCML